MTTTQDPISIVDVIDHKSKYFTQREIVVDRDPDFLFERRDQWLIGEDSGFFQFYYYERPSRSFQAFAGREFTIPMSDGTSIRATGQWWHGMPRDFRDLVVAYGVASIRQLDRCYVFCQLFVDQEMVEDWARSHEPSNNYHKYDRRHPEFGKHHIKSPW